MRLITVLLMALAAPLMAGEVSYNQVNLAVDASRQVENDTLVAVLSVQHDGSDPSELAGLVNQDMGWALETAKQSLGVQAQTLGYSSNPMYEKSHLVGWRVNQEMQIQGKDMAAMSELIGKLQAKLAVQSVGYRVSEEVRRQVEEQLITEAIRNFENRARLITNNLGRKGYKLVSLSINESNPSPIRPNYRMMAMQAEAAPAPAIEAGNQQLSVSVAGTIEVSQD